MSLKSGQPGIWPSKGEVSERNPRYLHTRLLSGSGYTPEILKPPNGWLETYGSTAFPTERIVADDWLLLEESEDLSSASRIWIAVQVIKGFQHVRDCKRVIIWDTKPEHILIQGFCSPDDISQIKITFIDLETIFFVDQHSFSTLGEPTRFTLDSIARQQHIMLQAGIFDAEAEVVECLIDYIREFNDASICPSAAVDQALDEFWTTAIRCDFDSFSECLNRLYYHVGSIY